MSDAQLPHDPAADAALVARLLAGDEAAFVGLVDSLHRPLLRIAEAFLGGTGAAEEVVQDTWVAVLQGLPRFEGRSQLRTWIAKILVNQAKTRRAKDRREVPVDAEAAETSPDAACFNVIGMWKQSPSSLPGADDVLFSKHAQVVLREEIGKLPEAQRAVVTLRDLEDWSSEEVCNVLGLSETNQRVLLHRGRQKLREAMVRRFGKEAAR